METLAAYVAGLADLDRRPAVIERGLYRTRTLSYGEVIGKAFTLAQVLRQHVAPGDRVLIWGASGGSWAIALYGCLFAGAVSVPIDAAFSGDYARRIQAHTGARLLLADAGRDLGAAADRLPFERLADLPVGRRPQTVFAAAPDALLEIVYTSGATAEPKGVMITHGNLLANLRPIESEIRKYRKWARPLLPLRFVHLIPLSHLFGQVMGLFIPPLLESAVVYVESQAAGTVAAAIKETRASVVVAVPQQIELLSDWALAFLGQTGSGAPDIAARVVAIARGHGVAWRWWRWRRLHRRLGWRMWAVIAGGAALPPPREELWNALGYAVVQGYGLTETAPAIAITHPFKIRRGAVGRKLAGMEVQIAGDGEILVRGGNVSPGYYRDPAATAEAFSDGWLHTGDLGRWEDGNLIFLGRKKEVIVTAEGLNVFPQDLELALDAQPEIQESAVVAADDQRTRVHAVVVPRPGVDESGVAAAVARANDRLEAHQRVRGFSLWPEPTLPRTASTGKLRRVTIGRWVNEATPSAPGGHGPNPASWRDYLAQLLHVRADRLTPEARFAELGLSSLGRVELLAWIETHTGADVEEADLAQATTVGDLDRLLDGDRARQSPARAVAASASFHYPRWPSQPSVRHLRSALRAAAVFPSLRTVARVETRGRENLRSLPRPVLFIANHQSLIDVPVILRALPGRWRPWIAPAMALDAFHAHFQPAGASAAERRRARRRYRLLELFFNIFVLSEATGIQPALRQAGKLAEHGYCPLIFPEGARTPDGRLHCFRPGIGVFVQALGVPVVPIVVEGLFEILPIGATRARRGRARVSFGPPLAAGESGPAAVTARLQAWFEEHIGQAEPDLGNAGH